VCNSRKLVARVLSWKGTAVQSILQHGSRGLAIVRSLHQVTCIEDTAGWKILFLIGMGVESNWVHSALQPSICLLCQPRVIMMMDKFVK
jgi:hypothetical protein